MRPRTDRAELEKYHEGLIVCSACLGGEVPKKITAGQLEEAEEAIRWYKNLFGDDYYLVVDYKTDRYKDESMHKGQITAYAEAMEDLYKKKCLAVLLYIRGMTEGTFLDQNGDEVKGL